MEDVAAKSLVLLYPTSGNPNKYLLQVKEWLQEDQTLQINEISTVADVGKLIAQYNRGLLIFSVRDKNDLVEVVNCLAAHQSHIKGRFLRVIGVSYMEHPEVIKLLMKRGVADILPTNLTSKALKHKISQSFKILERYHAGHAQDAARDAASAASAQEKKNAQATKNQPSVQRTAALTIASDCWLVRKEKDLRQIQGRWLVDLLGPGPSIASWDESPRSTSQAPEWVWVLRQPDADFISEDGNWVFRGRRPEFVWTENRWRFVGEHAELLFVRNGESIAYRVQCRPAQNVLEVAENSEQAKKKLPLMIKSIEAEVRFKNEKNKPNLAQQFQLGEKDDTEEAVEKETRNLAPVEEAAAAPTLAFQMWISADLQGKNPLQLAPIEMSPTEIVVEVPSGKFTKTQKVCLIVDTGLKKSNSVSQFEAIIATHEASDTEHDLLTIQIADGKVLPIESAAEEIRARQDEIFNFLKAARGW